MIYTDFTEDRTTGTENIEKQNSNGEDRGINISIHYDTFLYKQLGLIFELVAFVDRIF